MTGKRSIVATSQSATPPDNDARALVEQFVNDTAPLRLYAVEVLVERITTYANQRYVEGVEAAELKALEQRCERGTPWDAACVAAAKAIRALLNEEKEDG